MSTMPPLPPHSKEAEQALIGGLLRDPETMHDVLDVISAEALYFDSHQKLFSAIEHLFANGTTCDLVSIWEQITARGQREDVGGLDYLTELWEASGTGANARYHAKIVAERFMRRNVIKACNQILRDAYDSVSSGIDLVAQAQQMLFELSCEEKGGGQVHSAKDLLRDAYVRLDQRSRDEGITGITSGLRDLDEMTGGFKPGQLIVLAARPGGGKTSMGLGMAIAAASANVPTLIFSLEMSGEELADRVLTWGSGVPMKKIQRPQGMSQDEFQAVMGVGNPDRLGGSPLYVEDTSVITAPQIAAIARREIRRRKIGLIIVDYLSLIRPENAKDQRYIQVGLIALRMKQLARQCKVPVVLLAQLGRGVENRGKGDRPKLSDLRESGDIECHADLVLFLHPQMDEPTGPILPTDLILAKQRNGPKGPVTVAYRLASMRFENAAIGY
jgi:replicative DNA helicase